MKNLAKFFVAVAALFVGVSCTTDTTEDLGQQIVGKGQTVLTVSTGDGELRTSLGEKVDGSYPVYWSNGDKLSLNGKASAALADLEENAKVATFTWDGTFEKPFFLAYPAVTKNNTVKFASSQNYVEGTFAPNAVPMYAFVEESDDNVALKYLAGVLRIGIYAEEETKVFDIYLENLFEGPIAGTFDCANDGVLTPTKDVTTRIDYNAKNVVLSQDSAAPTYFHIAVPEGAYETLRLTIVTNKGTMTAKVKAGEDSAKGAIVAGQVREFNAIKFSAESGVILTINSIDDLFTFAELVKNQEFGENYDKAVLGADIYVDPETQPWVSIEGFNGIFDGQNHKIYNLNAPLFGETCATIHNLIIAAPQISLDQANIGAIASRLTRHDPYAGSLHNCHTELVDGVGFVEYSGVATADTDVEVRLGGLVGQTDSSHCLIEDCTNYAKVSFPATAIAASMRVGGIAGYNTATPLTNVKNYGTIDLKGTVKFGINTTVTVKEEQEDGSEIEVEVPAKISRYLVGGICGTGTVAVSGAENHGEINIAGEYVMLGTEYPTQGFAGCFGAKNSGGTADDVHNYGKLNISVTVNDGDIATNAPLYIGGIAAYAGSSKFTNCSTGENATITVSGNHNYSAISSENNGTNNYHGAALRIAGVIARGPNGEDYPYDNIVNNADIICNVNAPKTSVQIGGCFGDNNKSTYTNVTNNGDITFGKDAVCGLKLNIGGVASRHSSINPDGWVNNGDINFLGKSQQLHAGGIIGYSSIAVKNCTNTGCLNIAGATSCTNGVYYWKVGGIVGCTNNLIGCTNGVKNDPTKGVITITTTGLTPTKSWPGGDGEGTTFGGIVGHATSGNVDDCTNYGSIELASAFASRPAGKNVAITLGGISGYCGGNVINSTNNGSVTFSGEVSVTADLTVAGICARNGNNKGCTGCTNNGAITVSGDSSYSIAAAGLVTLCASGTYSGLTNNGPITVSGTTKTLHVGGVVSHEASAKGVVVFDDCKNTEKGTITVKGSTYTTLFAGGLAGKVILNKDTPTERTINNCHNAAAITVTDAVTVSTTTCIGGITGNWVPKETTGFIKESTNSGKLEFAGTSTENLYFGGIVGWSKKGELNACTNKGEVVFSGKAKVDAFISGVAGTGCNLIKDCWNKANISATSTSSVTNYILLGGVCGGNSHYLTEGLASSDDGAEAAHVLLEVNGGGCGYIDDDPTKKPMIKIETTPGTTKKVPRIGGVVGYLTSIKTSAEAYHTLQGITNNADIEYNTGGTAIKDGSVGGILGHTGGTITLKDCTNNGNLTIKNNGKYIGGIVGSYINSTDSTLDNWRNLTNNGNIVIENASTNFYVAGIVPRVDNSTTQILKNLHNSGDITVNEGVAQTTNVGGIAGYIKNKMDYCSSTGDLCVYNTVVTLSSGSKSTNYVGMFNGSNSANAARKITNSLVSGKIKRYTDDEPITIDDSNYMNYLFRNAATAGTYENISTTEMPQEPAQE